MVGLLRGGWPWPTPIRRGFWRPLGSMPVGAVSKRSVADMVIGLPRLFVFVRSFYVSFSLVDVARPGASPLLCFGSFLQ